MSSKDERYHAKRCMNEGAIGYIVKSAGINEIRNAIETAAAGNTWMSKEMSAVIE